MKGIIDRFEGEYAVLELEDKKMADIKKELLPPEAKEGDTIKLEEGKYIIDKAECKKRKEEIDNITKDLWE